MNGFGPHWQFHASPLGAYNDAALESRLPHDLAAARKLMAEAGYADGLRSRSTAPTTATSMTKICVALVACGPSWKGEGACQRHAPRPLSFPSWRSTTPRLYLAGWGGGLT